MQSRQIPPRGARAPLSFKTATFYENGRFVRERASLSDCAPRPPDYNNNARTLCFSTLSAPRALSPRRRGHFRPLIAAFRRGTHAQTPLDAPEACSGLSFRAPRAPQSASERPRAPRAPQSAPEHPRAPQRAARAPQGAPERPRAPQNSSGKTRPPNSSGKTRPPEASSTK